MLRAVMIVLAGQLFFLFLLPLMMPSRMIKEPIENYNKTKCRKCKCCLAEETCPFEDVITFRRSKEEKLRLKLAG